jgi:hypothetical protein
MVVSFMVQLPSLDQAPTQGGAAHSDRGLIVVGSDGAHLRPRSERSSGPWPDAELLLEGYRRRMDAERSPEALGGKEEVLRNG